MRRRRDAPASRERVTAWVATITAAVTVPLGAVAAVYGQPRTAGDLKPILEHKYNVTIVSDTPRRWTGRTLAVTVTTPTGRVDCQVTGRVLDPTLTCPQPARNRR